MAILPRGIRNNNPGNIDRTSEKWQGMSDDQSSDSRFIVFSKSEYGIRAIAKILQNYQKKYKISTVRGVISRWAPPSENNTDAYVKSVSDAVGVKPDDKVSLSDPKVLMPIIKAIIKHENGSQPYSDETIREGIDMALS